MKEKFKGVKLDGNINIYMNAEKGYWIADKRQIISALVSICEEYFSQHYSLTLRQLYYQLVARDLIPNHDKVYKKIGGLKDEAVHAGLIDWSVFQDRGRLPSTPYSEEGVQEALQKTVDCYRLDRQRNQTALIEVWTEKDAISSILKRITHPYGITLVVNKGYTSSTAIYGAYSRFIEEFERGGKVKILYFGDHDPSGLDMIRDIKTRLMFMFCNGSQLDEAFSNYEIDDWWIDSGSTIYDVADISEKYESVADLEYAEGLSEKKQDKLHALFDEGKKMLFLQSKDLFEVIQVGLTMDQIQEYNPPSNPAKMTDPRMKNYIAEFGKVSWEVDALKPKIMEQIVDTAIKESIDVLKFQLLMEEEKADKKNIQNIIDNL
jgi:hypothetical protein